MTTTEIDLPPQATNSLIVHAFKEQGLDLYWIEFTPSGPDEPDWTLKHRFRLAEWEELDECLDIIGLTFSFRSGHPQIKGTLDLVTWITIHPNATEELTEAWLIAHPSLRQLLTARDAEWFE